MPSARINKSLRKIKITEENVSEIKRISFDYLCVICNEEFEIDQNIIYCP